MQNSLERVVVTSPPYRPAASDGSLVWRRELSVRRAQGAADSDVVVAGQLCINIQAGNRSRAAGGNLSHDLHIFSSWPPFRRTHGVICGVAAGHESQGGCAETLCEPPAGMLLASAATAGSARQRQAQ